ncbi:MAG: LytTR family DNA-binding domain-containing protein [Bacteroidota bacterium]
MNYKCLIVDDERPALKLLTAYISKLPHLELIAACENAMQAIAALQKGHIDLLFLDIQMPELTGLDLLKILPNQPPVILTTAYREYAVEGFALDVTDYLVKPFAFDRFVQATNKATHLINLERTHVGANAEIAAPINTIDHFFVRTNYKMTRINFQDILYLESQREYVAIHTTTKKYLVHQSMNHMEQELPKSKFMRVHRSYLVALERIKTINGNTIIIGEKQIPIGTSYRKSFFEKIKLL